MIKLWLFLALVLTGITCVASLHFLATPLFNNILLHCILLGALFGTVNFIAVDLFYRRIKKLKEINRQLRLKLMLDPLTGLFNRRAFDLDMKNVEHNGVFSLLFIDIDNFRNFNNQFGHDVGDKILAKVGQTIKDCVRAADRVYRYGGEEIVLHLIDCDKKNAIILAEKIRSEISRLPNTPYPQITVSLGISSYPEDASNIHDVIVASDKALLLAKQSGKNCAIAY